MDYELRCVDDIGLSEESFAFLLYILRVSDGVQGATHELIFAKCDEKFGQAQATWATIFASEEGTIEYWIIEKDGKATALASRYIDNDGDESYMFTQFIMLPIDVEGVKKLVKKLPSVMSYASKGSVH